MTAADREEIRRMMAEEKVIMLDEDEMVRMVASAACGLRSSAKLLYTC